MMGVSEAARAGERACRENPPVTSEPGVTEDGRENQSQSIGDNIDCNRERPRAAWC
jgi:hypothetical protein